MDTMTDSVYGCPCEASAPELNKHCSQPRIRRSRASFSVMLVNLGAQMSLQDRSAGRAVPLQLVVGIVIGRLVLMPVGASVGIFLSVAAGLLPADRILLLLLLLQGATPTAMSLGTISQMHGQYEMEIAEILFVVNVVSVPFFTLSVGIFLALLDPDSGFLEQLLPPS